MGCVYCIFDTVPEQIALHICKHLNGGSNRHRDGCRSVDPGTDSVLIIDALSDPDKKILIPYQCPGTAVSNVWRCE